MKTTDIGGETQTLEVSDLVAGIGHDSVAPARRTRRHREVAERLVTATLLCDAVVVIYALIVSFFIRFHTPLAAFGVNADPTLSDYSGYIACGAILMLFLLFRFGIYERQKALRFHLNSWQMLKATGVWFGIFIGTSLFFKFNPLISRVFVVVSAVNVLAFLWIWRSLLHRYLLRSPIARALRQRVLFVGWTPEADRLAGVFGCDPAHAFETVGCIPALRRGQNEPSEAGVPVIANYEDLPEVLQRQEIDMVILTDLNLPHGEVVGLSNLCEREMVEFKIVPSFFQILVSALHLETVAGVPMLGVSQLPLDRPFNSSLKRTFDVIGALIGLALAAPIIAVFALLVYWESPGPVFYRQRRLGRSGRIFDMIKIRSMKLDAEKDGKVGWTVENDPRRLKIGALMRSWNVDELPQFWNVLKGEMSLVGPRPERPELIMAFKDEIPHYNARHNVKPGITGWAQMQGLRGNTDLQKRINSDLYYLENWSILLDIYAIFRTVLNRRNAY